MQATTDHHEIRQWVEKYDGHPIRLAYDSTGATTDPISIEFPNVKKDFEQNIQRIDWDEFFAIFDNNQLVFKYFLDDENEPMVLLSSRKGEIS